MKKIFFMSIITLLIFIIYLGNIDKKIYYVSLTSKTGSSYNDHLINMLSSKNMLEKSILDFNKDNYRVIDFINLIENNKEININNKKQNIKNALIKADVLVLEVGKEDLINIRSNKDIDNIIINIDEYFKLIRQYCKEDILVIPVYTNDISSNLVNNFNDKLNDLSNEYKMIYINSSKLNLINNMKKSMEQNLFEN